jgi:uncharacterized membrane-anchored protein YhcB (DUF1043 family)
MNQHLSNTWISLGLEVIVGILIYTFLIYLLKADIINQLKKLVENKIRR